MKNLIYILLFVISFQSCSTTKSKFDFDKVLWSTDWAPDDKLITIGGNNNELKFLSPHDLKVTKSIKKSNTITKIKWHPDVKHLAISRQKNDKNNIEDRKAEIINTTDSTSIKLDVIDARGLGWDKSGEYLAVGDGEGDLSIFSKDGRLIKKIITDQKSIIGLSWHPNDKTIVTVGSHIEIIDIESEKSKKVIPREIEILMLSVAWHPSGEFFVTGDYGDFILEYEPLLIFWNHKGEKIKEIKGSKAEYRNLDWNQKGDLLATASDKVRTWSRDGKLIKERNLGSLLWGIDWNANGTELVTTTEDGKVFILNEELKVLNSKE